MKKIAIDIDDTVADTTTSLMKYAIEFDKQYARGEGVVDSTKDITRCFNWTSEENKLFLEKVLDKHADEIVPVSNAVQVLNKLKEEGYEIIFISSRNDNQMRNPYERTLAWLNKNKFQFDKLIVKARYKGPVIEEERANVFIDDSVGQTTFVADNYNVDVILFTKNKFQYNNITVINNWNDIYNHITTNN